MSLALYSRSLIKHGLHESKSLLPFSQTLLNCLPLLIHNVTLNYDLLLNLIDLSINNAGSNGFDGPLFDIILLDVKGISKVLVLVI